MMLVKGCGHGCNHELVIDGACSCRCHLAYGVAVSAGGEVLAETRRRSSRNRSAPVVAYDELRQAVQAAGRIPSQVPGPREGPPSARLRAIIRAKGKRGATGDLTPAGGNSSADVLAAIRRAKEAGRW